ncbi:MAG: hypothetical protein KGS72_16390 [Cyanobacteria bacterium REEB67]|nr:hypothetical protein [Cyanobacteria bacterium REEB67]
MTGTEDGTMDETVENSKANVNPKNKKVAAGIIAVICLGALYVAYSMYVQFDEHSNNQFRSADAGISEQARNFLKPKENPYQSALLSLAPPPNGEDESEQLVQLIQTKCGNLLLEPRLSRSHFPDPNCQKFFRDIDNACKSGDYQGGLKTVATGLVYCQQHPDVQRVAELDLLLLGIKLANKTGQFDQARLYADRGLASSRLFQDYKMDEFEGLSCLLGGNLAVAEQYQKLLTSFNDNFRRNQNDRLAAIADALVRETAVLGEGNFFRLNAQLARAVSLNLGKKQSEALVVLKELRAAAAKVHDLRLVTVCENFQENIGKSR